MEPIRAASEEVPVEETEVEEVVEEVVEEQSNPDVTEEKVVTQESEESIRMKQVEAAKRKAEAAEKKKQQEADRKEKARKAAAEKVRKEREAKRKALDAAINGVKNSSGSATGGEGNDSQAGDKGQLDGNPYANSYYGNGGGGSGGYGLRGRTLTKSGVGYEQDCNEYGIVVVKIEVDKTGTVRKATPGVKGSTNTAPCLMAPAIKSAKSYKWNLDSKAPSKQIGFIIVKFT